MTIDVFFKWRPAAILDFCGSEIWSYFCFQDVGFSLWAIFYLSSCNTDRLMAVKVNFQNGRCRHLGFFSELKCQVSASRGLPISTSTLNLVKITQRPAELWRFMCFQNGGRPPSWIFCGSISWRYFCFRNVGFSLWAKFCANMCNCDRVMAV